jgi:hypothetical protein
MDAAHSHAVGHSVVHELCPAGCSWIVAPLS